jgi:hypothetical protein
MGGRVAPKDCMYWRICISLGRGAQESAKWNPVPWTSVISEKARTASEVPGIS